MDFEFVYFVTLDVWQIDCIRAMRTTQTIEYDDRIVINPISCKRNGTKPKCQSSDCPNLPSRQLENERRQKVKNRWPITNS